MEAYLASNSTQLVRRFLDRLNIHPPIESSTKQIAALLIEEIEKIRTNPESSLMIIQLIRDLSGSSACNAEQLPSPECETADIAQLTERLKACLPESYNYQPDSTSLKYLASAAAMLIWMAGFSGCGNFEGKSCENDLSQNNFFSLMNRSDNLTMDDKEYFSNQYGSTSTFNRMQVIDDLCGMSGDEIVSYLEDVYGSPSGDDNDDVDSVPIYKGVSF